MEIIDNTSNATCNFYNVLNVIPGIRTSDFLYVVYKMQQYNNQSMNRVDDLYKKLYQLCDEHNTKYIIDDIINNVKSANKIDKSYLHCFLFNEKYAIGKTDVSPYQSLINKYMNVVGKINTVDKEDIGYMSLGENMNVKNTYFTQ